MMIIDRIIETLNSSDIAWLLPNLRQDIAVWNSLNDPSFFEKFLQSKQPGSTFIPSDFAPGKLALLALDQTSNVTDPAHLLDSIDSQVVQNAIHNFNDDTLLSENRQDLISAGFIALALAFNFRATNSWKDLLDSIQENPNSCWSSSITCLYSYLNDPKVLLNALVQPGASSLRINLAVHTILSNPISPNDQIATLMDLCHGAFGDPLPASDCLSLVLALNEQHPRLAKDFCTKWLETHQQPSTLLRFNHQATIDKLNQLTEYLFRVEVRKISGKSQNLVDLLIDGSSIIQSLYPDLINQFIVSKNKYQSDRTSAPASADFLEKVIQINQLNAIPSTFNANQAELALILANLGQVDEAERLLPYPDVPLPDNIDILFAIAKLSLQSGNFQRSWNAVSRILELLNNEAASAEITIWGDYLSLANLGKLLLDLHKPLEATRIFDHALKSCPNDVSLLRLLAESYQSSHLDQEATETLHVVVALEPHNLDYRREFAQSLENLGDWDACLKERSFILELSINNNKISISTQDKYDYAHCALKAGHPQLTLKVCNEILLPNPEDSQALIFIGEAYLQLNEADKGMEFLLHATQVSPNLPEAWLALASAQRNIFPIKTVIETLKNASLSIPDSPKIHFTLGDLYLQDNAPTLAVIDLNSAVELSPNNPQYLFGYAQALKMLGKIEEARDVLSKAYSLEPYYPGLAHLYSRLLIDLGEFEHAIAPLEVLINTNSHCEPSLYLDYARSILTLHKLGSTTTPPMKALIALNQVLQIEPNLAEAKALTAEALIANGENELAFQAYREALDTPLAEDKNWFERLSLGFGCTASTLGRYDIAIAALQEAGQSNPNNPSIFTALSDAYLSANLSEDALRSARNVLIIDGDNPDNLSWFAGQISKVLHNEKSEASNSASPLSKQLSSEALSALSKAIKLAPTRADLLVQLGKFQSSIGANAEAQVTLSLIASLDFATIEDLKRASKFLSEIGDHTSAIACLENGIAQDQKASEAHDAALYTILATEYVTNHNHTSAINTLDKAIEIIPEDNSLISLKINILLGLGQLIDALNCIEASLQNNALEKPNIDIVFLASQINRSMGNFAAAIKYTNMGIALSISKSTEKKYSQLPIRYRVQIAELYRALLQSEQAYQVFNSEINFDALDFNNEQAYLDFVLLHTELALESGGEIKPDIQDIHLEASNPNFSRLMAIESRLMNKAGNYKQAEALFQLALENRTNVDQSNILPSWSAPYNKYLNLNSLLETALDLNSWDKATEISRQLLETAENEPLPYLYLARVVIQKAEFTKLCDAIEVTHHKPAVDTLEQESLNLCRQHLENAKLILQPYQVEPAFNDQTLTLGQIYRWQARSDIVFENIDEAGTDAVEILAQKVKPGDSAALISYLHRIHLREPDSDSLTNIIKLARAYPRNPNVILHVASVLQDNNPIEAIKTLQLVLQQNPYTKNPSIAFCNILLAKITLSNGKYELARDAVESAIEFWSDEPRWHLLAAKIYEQLSDINNATQHLLTATELAPNNIAFHLELGQIYFENSNEDSRMLHQAHGSFEKALGMDPKNICALVYLANTYFLLNNLGKAESHARDALILAPERPDIYQLLSEIAIKNNDFHGAYEYANKAIQLSPMDVQTILILVKSLSALGRNNEALIKLNSMIPLVKDSKPLLLERVNILKLINGDQPALNELKTLTISYPDDFDMLETLSQLYFDLGEIDNAVITAQQALAVCQKATLRNRRANLYLMIGQVQRHTGQLDQSIQNLSEAIELSPDRLEPYLELGLARKERREYQQALQIFECATNIAPDDPRAAYQAGLALKESKDYKSSEVMLRRAVSLAPNDLNMRRQLAAVVALNLVHNPRTVRNYPK